jgi:hypothetical protein
MNWHYAKDGEKKGPISEEELKQLFESGQISSNDLVWKEGMSEWSSYGSVFQASTSDSSEGDASPPATTTPVTQSTPMPATNGTGGQTPNSELRARALSGNWGPAIGVFVVSYILMLASGIIPIIGIFTMLIFIGPLMMGLFEYYLRRHRNANAEFSHLFSGFSNFALGLVLYLLLFLISLGATLVAAIPGGIIMGITGAMSSGGSVEQNPLFWVGLVVLYIGIIMVSLMV